MAQGGICAGGSRTTRREGQNGAHAPAAGKLQGAPSRRGGATGGLRTHLDTHTRIGWCSWVKATVGTGSEKGKREAGTTHNDSPEGDRWDRSPGNDSAGAYEGSEHPRVGRTHSKGDRGFMTIRLGPSGSALPVVPRGTDQTIGRRGGARK